MNLAPVADVAERAGAVGDGRAHVRRRRRRGGGAHRAPSVAGIRAGGVAATAKHFPGLGGAAVNTDDGSGRPCAARRARAARPGPVPRRRSHERVPLVMLSHALYPALDADAIASQSRAVVDRPAARASSASEGVVVTDSLEAQAVLARSGVAAAAERSVRAGADLILMTGSASWNEVFPRAARGGATLAGFRRARVARERALACSALKRLALRLRPRSSARSISSRCTERVPPGAPLPGAVGASSQANVSSAKQRSSVSSISATSARVLDRREQLDARVEVARHEVGRADPVAALVAALEAVDARVLEEAADDRDHADVLRHARHARAQAADAAHVQVHLHARLRGLVEGADAARVHERVHLQDDPRLLAGLVRLDGALDLAQEPVAHVVGRDDRLAVVRRARGAGQRVEELGHVRGELGVAS